MLQVILALVQLVVIAFFAHFLHMVARRPDDFIRFRSRLDASRYSWVGYFVPVMLGAAVLAYGVTDSVLWWLPNGHEDALTIKVVVFGPVALALFGFSSGLERAAEREVKARIASAELDEMRRVFETPDRRLPSLLAEYQAKVDSYNQAWRQLPEGAPVDLPALWLADAYGRIAAAIELRMASVPQAGQNGIGQGRSSKQQQEEKS